MEVDSSFIAKWVDALRSGQYLQGTGYLMKQSEHTGYRPMYCCIGVACNLIDSEGWRNPVQEQFVRDEDFPDETYTYNPDDVVWGEESSINDQLDIPFLDRDAAGRLANWNDAQVPFEIIADRITALAYLDNGIIYLKDDTTI